MENVYVLEILGQCFRVNIFLGVYDTLDHFGFWAFNRLSKSTGKMSPWAIGHLQDYFFHTLQSKQYKVFMLKIFGRIIHNQNKSWSLPLTKFRHQSY